MELERIVLDHESAIRVAFFLGILGVVGLWEVAAPRRVPVVSRALRWGSNLSLVALNTLMLRLVFPLTAAGIAVVGATRGWGVLNHFQAPPGLALAVSVIAMDFAIWLQHVVFHAVPVLWRLHRVHHADIDYDVTTGVRFHPLEIVLSMLIKWATIAVLGPPVAAVVIFEVLLNASAMFNHGNVRIPAGIDRWLRLLVVTPDMHRVHHSIEEQETNSNFGFNLPWWDRLFGTYRDQPRAGHRAMTIGLREHREPHEVARLDGLLLLPFRGGVGNYPIGRRHWRNRKSGR